MRTNEKQSCLAASKKKKHQPKVSQGHRQGVGGSRQGGGFWLGKKAEEKMPSEHHFKVVSLQMCTSILDFFSNDKKSIQRYKTKK